MPPRAMFLPPTRTTAPTSPFAGSPDPRQWRHHRHGTMAASPLCRNWNRMTHDTSRRWQMLAIAAVIIFVIWLLAPVLMPFAIAAMLAYLGDPLADRLQRLGMGRTWAVSIVFTVIALIFIGTLLLLVPLIQHQFENLAENLPRYVEWARSTALPWIQQRLHLDADVFDSDRLIATIKEHIGSVSSVLATAVAKVAECGMGVR